MERRELVDHRGAQMHVEIGERLVEKHDGGFHGEAARERHALTLPAAEFRRSAFFVSRQANGCERAADPCRVRLALDAGDVERVADVSSHIKMRPQRVGLEDDADAPVLRRHVLARRRDLAAGERDAPAIRRVRTPQSSRSSVVLPQPDGPKMATNSPSAMVRLTPSTAGFGPNRFSSAASVT